MTTKFFGFRLSGDLLDQAAEKIGFDQVSVIAKQLLIEYLSSGVSDSILIASQNTDDSKKKQPDRIDQIEVTMADILTRLESVESQLFVTSGNHKAAIAADIDILPEVTDMSKPVRLTPRKELLALLGLDDKAGTKYIQDTFKRVTGINPVKSDLSYPVGMLNYLKENPDILSKKPA